LFFENYFKHGQINNDCNRHILFDIVFDFDYIITKYINLLVEGKMIKIEKGKIFLQGPKGTVEVKENDEITIKLAMLFEGQCEGKPIAETAEKFGYSRQRYNQLNKLFLEQGAEGLKKQKTGPKRNYARTPETVRLIIRYRFLDPQVSPAVIAQKLSQTGHNISLRSVERVITEYGLQKKTPSPAANEAGDKNRNTSHQKEDNN